MTPQEFKNWRKEMGFSQTQAAEKLGLSKATIENYDKGTRREDGREVVIPQTVALACSALYKGLKPWPFYAVETIKPITDKLEELFELVKLNLFVREMIKANKRLATIPISGTVDIILQSLNEYFSSKCLPDILNRYVPIIVEITSHPEKYKEFFNPIAEAIERNNKIDFAILTYAILERIRIDVIR